MGKGGWFRAADQELHLNDPEADAAPSTELLSI